MQEVCTRLLTVHYHRVIQIYLSPGSMEDAASKSVREEDHADG